MNEHQSSGMSECMVLAYETREMDTNLEKRLSNMYFDKHFNFLK